MECQFSRWLSLNVQIFKMVLFGNELPVISLQSAFVVVKGGAAKPSHSYYCVHYISAPEHQIFKTLYSTPLNSLCITIGGWTQCS